MIHKFIVSNFYSIGDEQELDFTSGKLYSDSSTKFDDTTYISNVNCFVGANASGKTNIFKALTFLLWFAENSFYFDKTKVENLFIPHLLKKEELTKFSLIFDINNNLYNYKVAFQNGKLVEETLYNQGQKTFTYLYRLRNDGDDNITIDYNRNNLLKRINKSEEERFKGSPNSSFLSFLMGTNYSKPFGFNKIVSDLYSNLYYIDSRSYNHEKESVNLSKTLENYQGKDELLSYIRSFDFGIENYDINDNFIFRTAMGSEKKLVGFTHTNNNKTFVVSAMDESAGTIKGISLLIKLLNVLTNGGVAIIDEFDARLHYDIARKLISLFANKETNQNNAQLFFSTHQPLFLNDRDKKQIFLCYKEDFINTEVYRLDEIEGVRNTENFFEKYLSGEYGATPRLGTC
ncbi:AAA family ATPase [bacterium]|nr:AAA family ATPase [bacterium]